MPGNAQAEACKQRGNDAFAKSKLEAAIEAYSEAICFDPAEAVYYTNRAMCHRRKASWEAVVADCTTALQLDDTSIKGHYLLGVALDSEGHHERAASHLLRALDLCKERTVSYKEDIQRAMYTARKRQWAEAQPAAEAQVEMTEALVARLLRSHFEQEAAALGGSSSRAGGGEGGGSSTRLHALRQEEQQTTVCVAEALGALRSGRGPSRFPDYLCCKITMEPMLEPVTTPDGISYEKSVLAEHLKKVGHFDPVTRRPLEAHQCIPNLALKEAAQTFLQDHPWAYDCAL